MQSKSKIWILCLLLPIMTFGQSVDDIYLEKLDPLFHHLVSEEIGSLKKAAFNSSLVTMGKTESDEILYAATIYTRQSDVLNRYSLRINSRLKNFATAHLTASEIKTIVALETVTYIESATLEYPLNDTAVGWIGADLLHNGYINNTTYKGTGVIVCIIDTGIDWEHLDFRHPDDPTKTRILAIWDQTLTPTGGEGHPGGFNFGVEYDDSDINAELDGSPAGFVRTEDTNGHGTHVAGSAVGNGMAHANGKYAGTAPEADIIIVKGGDDSVPNINIIDGLNWARGKALAEGKPIVVNMSLGSNQGAHDGKGSKDVAIDEFTSSGPGRIVVVSAGNEGDNAIHKMGSLGNGSITTFSLLVPEFTAQDEFDNDDFGFDVWFDGSGSASITVTSPNGFTTTQSTTGSKTNTTNDGKVVLVNRHSNSGPNVERFLRGEISDASASTIPSQGTWRIEVRNTSGETMNYHFWLYDWSIGEEFEEIALDGGDTQYTLSNTANSAIIVGSYVNRWRWAAIDGNEYWGGAPDQSDDISPFSSMGPTRDGRQKPDITAPGDKIVSSRSHSINPSEASLVVGEKHTLNQGTSMASPVVAGAAALLLQQRPSMTSLDLQQILTNTADSDATTGEVWNAHWGHGRLDIFQAMVPTVNKGFTGKRDILTYDKFVTGQGTSTLLTTLDFKFSQRFTPTFSSEFTGVFFHTGYSKTQDISLSGPLTFEVWADNGGIPGAKIGNTINFDHEKVIRNSWHFVSFAGSSIDCIAGQDYHLVIQPQAGDHFVIYTDATRDLNRSYYFNGQWQKFGETYRIRPVMTTDRSELPSAIGDVVSVTPEKFDLSPNYPNPFNPTTHFTYQLPAQSNVEIRIFDMLGRRVKTIVDTHQAAGHYTAEWDGKDDLGLAAASGVYFLRMKAGSFSKVRKITLIR